MEIIIQPDAAEAAAVAARIIADQVRRQPHSVLGLATGATVVPVYEELVRMHRQEGLDFSHCVVYNLDEYLGLDPHHPSSYHSFMRTNLLEAIDLPDGAFHIPDGLTDSPECACSQYEQSIADAGGIDLQILGIGRDGHIGFNEPSSSLASRTRVKTLTRQTIEDNSRFFAPGESVPQHVITMGIGTILESRRCLLLAWGDSKAQALAAAVEGPVTASVPASALQLHPRVQVLADERAAFKLAQSDYYRWVWEHKPAWQRV